MQTDRRLFWILPHSKDGGFSLCLNESLPAFRAAALLLLYENCGSSITPYASEVFEGNFKSVKERLWGKGQIGDALLCFDPLRKKYTADFLDKYGKPADGFTDDHALAHAYPLDFFDRCALAEIKGESRNSSEDRMGAVHLHALQLLKNRSMQDYEKSAGLLRRLYTSNALQALNVSPFSGMEEYNLAALNMIKAVAVSDLRFGSDDPAEAASWRIDNYAFVTQCLETDPKFVRNVADLSEQCSDLAWRADSRGGIRSGDLQSSYLPGPGIENNLIFWEMLALRAGHAAEANVPGFDASADLKDLEIRLWFPDIMAAGIALHLNRFMQEQEEAEIFNGLLDTVLNAAEIKVRDQIVKASYDPFVKNAENEVSGLKNTP